VSIGECLDEGLQSVGVEVVDQGVGERDWVGLHAAEGARDLRGGDGSSCWLTVSGLGCGIRLGLLVFPLLFGVMEAYVHGVSTRSVDDLVGALGVGSGISKSEVSRICAGLDTEIARFRERTLTHTSFPYVFLDATFCKVRVGRSGGCEADRSRTTTFTPTRPPMTGTR
jgi:hypothetical protein